ncbi:hypothetical protein EOA13_28235 [Mesorhizobium sp. M7A.F.Ca.US.011.01.1.1]|nr:hypothetical protein EOA13_28235 [Mesorhizobium sp. M7A.F.Ca.US.011.01.1.1]
MAEDADIETNCFELVAPVARSQTAEELMASTTGCTSAAPIVVLGRSFSIIDQLEAEGLAVERLAALGVQLPYQVVIAEARFILGDRWHAYGCKPVVQLLKQVFAGTDTQVDAKGPEEAAKFIMSNCKCPLQRSRSCPIMLLAPRG